MGIQREQSIKSLHGNDLNYRVYDYIKRFNLAVTGKEYKVNRLSGFESDSMRLDCYFETDKLYKFGTEYRKIRVAIDNTTTLRADRLRGKQYEAFLLRQSFLVDYFLVITEEKSVLLNEYNKDEFRVVQSEQRKILDKLVCSQVDNIVTFDSAKLLLKELIENESDKDVEALDFLNDLNEKYRYKK